MLEICETGEQGGSTVGYERVLVCLLRLVVRTECLLLRWFEQDVCCLQFEQNAV